MHMHTSMQCIFARTSQNEQTEKLQIENNGKESVDSANTLSSEMFTFVMLKVCEALRVKREDQSGVMIGYTPMVLS